jgi:predicted Zn-dependent peptidase
MSYLDRSIMPEVKLPKQLLLPKYEKTQLSNGLLVYLINAGVQDVCKVEWVFNAGRWQEAQKHVGRFTNRILKEGSSKYASFEISEKLDILGASFRNFSSVDHGNISVVSLNKYLPQVFEIVEDVIKRPAFSEKELQLLITNSKEKLKVEKEKNEYLADEQMSEALYGNTHAYGYGSEEKNYDLVNVDLLKTHHQSFYNAANGFIIVSGKIEKDLLPLLEKHFGGNDWKGTAKSIEAKTTHPSAEKILIDKKKDALQSAIRICVPTIGKRHVDFKKLSVLNTILGGYFGSRLMSNIREDKGYTYGIYSGITNMLHDAFFHVSTEVGIDVAENAVNEIIYEINRLKNELVNTEEIDLVRNYLTGKMLGNLDSPFSIAMTYKNLFAYGLEVDYMNELMETVHTITANDLQEMANKYFNVDEMYQIVVG